MNPGEGLSGRNILVTGASGFMGSRLVEYLALACHANVRALVRSYGPAVGIARLPVALVQGDITDLDALRKAAAGVDVIFHCAAGMSGEDQDRIAATIDGTRNVLEVATEQKVARFVHVSTAAVHGPDPGPAIDENTPLVKSGDLYADSKIEAERLVSQAGAQKGLPVTILRPTVVYGPRSGSWTIGPISQMRSGKFTLIDGGQGIANPVYIDDVVQALLLAAVRSEAAGETFLISGNQPVPWKTFFGYYADWLGIDLPSISTQEIVHLRKQFTHLKSPFYMGATFIASPHAQSIVKQIRGLDASARMISRVIPKGLKASVTEQAAALRQIKIAPPSLPRPWIVSLYTARGVCSIEKARRCLGYEPQVSLEQGMQLTREWLRYTRLIPESS